MPPQPEAITVSPDGATLAIGRVIEDPSRVYEPQVALAETGKVLRARCGCFFAKQHGIKQGLCEHALALLLVYEG